MVGSIALLILGFGFLSYGAKLLVDGGVALGKRLRVSDLTIGLAVIAVGTSMPELSVNLLSAFEGNTDIALGNVVGSNIANTLLILGISGVVYPLTVKKQTTYKEVPFALLASAIIVILGLDHLWSSGEYSILSRGDGIILLTLFGVFIYYLVSIARAEGETVGDVDTVAVTRHEPVPLIIGFIALGLLGLGFGGSFIVHGAIDIARTLGASESFIGMTVVAIGTSLPELASSVAAAVRKKTDIVIGNVIGSNIFNVFLILGTTAVILPVPIKPEHYFPLGTHVLAASMVLVGLIVGVRHSIGRATSAALIGCYLAYLVTSVLLA